LPGRVVAVVAGLQHVPTAPNTNRRFKGGKKSLGASLY